jgi:penicillin-binding protein 2
MKRKNIFEPLTGVKAKNTHVTSTSHSKNERWLFGVLPSDDDAPTVEDEKKVRRYYGFMGIVFLLFSILIGRAFYLQIVKGDTSLILAQENRFRQQIIRAPRGLFYDRNKIPLVKNIPNYEVTVVPNDLPKIQNDREIVYARLATTIGISRDEIATKAEAKGLKYTQPLLVAKSVTRDVSLIFESRQSELKGFYVGINPIREYLDNGLLSHVFGYVGRISEEELKKYKDYTLTDYIGKSGLEQSYENILKGVSGNERVEVDSSGKIIRIYGQENPVLGDNMMLSIDFELQKKLTENLTKQMERAKVQKGAALAINPRNGEVLAFVSLPTFDNNLFAKGISEADFLKLANDKNTPLIDRVTSGEYPSGSIIKPFYAAAALEEKTVTESTTVSSTGGITIGAWTFPDWKPGGHGVTNVIKAIADSVNTFFYAIGGGYQNIKGLGPDLLKKYLYLFGFGSATSLDISGEAEGSIPDPEWKERVKAEQWYLGDTYNMSIGQGDVLITPLQMANALQVIANGGTMYKLHFLKAVLDGSGNIKSEKSPEVVKKDFISSSTIDIVRRGMRQTIMTGSGRALSSLPVAAAGKTGTAQYGPNNEKKHAWFTCFAPYDNPEIAMVVLVEGGGEGSDFAVPVANDTLKWYFTR